MLAEPRRFYQIIVGQLFDSISRTLIPNQVVTVDRDSGLILEVSNQGETTLLDNFHEKTKKGTVKNVETINLSSLTLLPGLIDVHVHMFLHPYSEKSWEDQVTKESLAERTIRATVHARSTLMAGYTTVRDLGTEGAFDADVALRKCLAGRNALIPGPRYYCSTRALISSGSYGPRSLLYPAQDGVDGVKGAEFVDGVDQCVKEVRRQIGAGADWIKIYADYPCRSRMSEVSSSISTRNIITFNKEELSAMITASHARGVKVAAHANTAEAFNNLLEIGADSIEHGGAIYDAEVGDKSLLKKLAKASGTTVWVPTLAAYYTANLSGTKYGMQRWEKSKRTFEEALTMKGDYELENVACGGDTGVFKHGNNALELVLMRRLGASWDRVLGWATYGGWKCIRGMEWSGEEGKMRIQAVEEAASKVDLTSTPESDLERGVPFGAIRVGWAADLVGFEGVLNESVQEFEETFIKGPNFVMKGGLIYLNGGKSKEVV